jgi:hypothetical protein
MAVKLVNSSSSCTVKPASRNRFRRALVDSLEVFELTKISVYRSHEKTKTHQNRNGTPWSLNL